MSKLSLISGMSKLSLISGMSKLSLVFGMSKLSLTPESNPGGLWKILNNFKRLKTKDKIDIDEM
jgi:hypothetical protein